ncbi:MAG: glycoside hydrolase [Elusimicrobia bacterium]|nr:glycoside hydrolase [Elusimicrobiota bacterium]
MTKNLTIYTVIHQPQRIQLPANPIPDGTPPEKMKDYLFDDEMNKYYLNKVASECYFPATKMFRELMDEGWKMSVGISMSFIEQAKLWNKKLFSEIQEFVAHPNLELVGIEPDHSFLLYMDIELFMEKMIWMKKKLEALFNKKINVTDTTEMFMSNDVYYALQKIGFKGAVMDGRPWILGWREPTYLYTHPDEKMKLIMRHWGLSDDVGYRFSNKSWPSWPLDAPTYAEWIHQTWGDFVMLGWDFETFGEHHKWDTGIFEFIRHLPEELDKRDITMRNPSELIELYSDSTHSMKTKEFGCTWAGGGGVEFFLGNYAQQALFRLMHHVINKAKLTENKTLLDLAIRLTQSDNLHLIQWAGAYGQEAEVSAYFTPDEWWLLGPDKLLTEQQRVYINFLRAMDRFV